MMQLYTEIGYELPKHFNNSIRYTYNFLLSKYPSFKRFPLSKKELSNKLNLRSRQIEYQFSKLENCGFLERSYDTMETEERKIGNALFLTLTPPIVKQNNEHNKETDI